MKYTFLLYFFREMHFRPAHYQIVQPQLPTRCQDASWELVQFSFVLQFSYVKSYKNKSFFLVWKFINRLLFKIRCYVFVLPTAEKFTREEISQMWENFGIWFRELANFYPHKSTKKRSPNSRNEILRKYLLAKLSTSLKFFFYWKVLFYIHEMERGNYILLRLFDA